MTAGDLSLSAQQRGPVYQHIVGDLVRRRPDSDAMRLYHRFALELARGAHTDAALYAAEHAAALADAHPASGDPIGDLRDLVARTPRTVPAGDHRPVPGTSLTVLNLTERPVDVAERELALAWGDIAGEQQVTLVVDDDAPDSVKRAAGGALTWTTGTVPADRSAYEHLAASTGRPCETALRWPRHPVAPTGGLPSEVELRADRAARLVRQALTTWALQRPDGQQIEVGDEHAVAVCDTAARILARYTLEPRVAVACRAPDDLSETRSWAAGGPGNLRALLGLVTGDDQAFMAAMRHDDHIRVGVLALTGDPDHRGDDLTSVALPQGRVWALLRPHVMSRSVFLPCPPNGRNEVRLPRPGARTYSACAVADQAMELLMTRVWLELAPTVSEEARAWMRDQTQQLHLRTDLGSLSDAAIRTVRAACAAARDETMTLPIESAIRAAVTSAIAQAISNPGAEPVSALVVGELSPADVEQVVVTVADADELLAYRRDGVLPSYLRPAVDALAPHGIRITLREGA